MDEGVNTVSLGFQVSAFWDLKLVWRHCVCKVMFVCDGKDYLHGEEKQFVNNIKKKIYLSSHGTLVRDMIPDNCLFMK